VIARLGDRPHASISAGLRRETAVAEGTSRYVPQELRARTAESSVGEYLDRLNRQLLDRLQREGEVFVSNAVVRGRFVLRACIVNFHTDVGDVEEVPSIVTRVGRSVHSLLREEGVEAGGAAAGPPQSG